MVALMRLVMRGEVSEVMTAAILTGLRVKKETIGEITGAAQVMREFAVTGQLLNLNSLGNDTGVSHVTARSWIDLLQTSYIIHLLPPWFTNTGKRLIKAPKLYFYDVGLACWLIGLRSAEQVARDPLWGSLFENFVIMEAMKDRLNAGESPEMYFYRDSEGNEVDLLLPVGGKMHAIEIKAGATVNPDYFKGLKTFAAHHPDAIAGGGVVYGGAQNQSRSDWPVYSWLTLQTQPAAETTLPG